MPNPNDARGDAERTAAPSHPVLAFCLGARPLWLLVAVSLAVGLLHSFMLFPVSLLRGDGPFWEFPRGIISGAYADMAGTFTGYTYLVKSDWTYPLLQAPLLGWPAGTNIFWTDSVPWVALLGKLIHALSGEFVNLLGLYLLSCFVLPGLAFTLLLWNAGLRSLAAAFCGSVIADTTPFLLFRWGHIGLNAHYFVIFALALYMATRRRGLTGRLQLGWVGVLLLAVLSHVYLFVMAGAIWAAALVQSQLDLRRFSGVVAAHAAFMVAAVLAVVVLSGEFGSNLASATTGGFGAFSMNLLSPLMPQMSGVVFPTAHVFFVGTYGQYEGFSYLGMGVLLLLLVNFPALIRWLKDHWRRHAALLAVFVVFLVFALSNRVYAGGHLILDVPLPEPLLRALGAFRSSGRFFWPLGYTVEAVALFLTFRLYAPWPALAIALAAALLEFVDVQPIRAEIIASSAAPAPATVDRADLAARVAGSRGVIVYPSFGCTQDPSLGAKNMELMLAAGRAYVPINAVYNTRIQTDCAAEREAAKQPLKAGILYVYLTDDGPEPAQIPGRDIAQICTVHDGIRFCRLLGDP